MIVKSNANFLKSNEEILPMDSDSLPYLCMSAELTQFSGNSISWHWHSAFEIDYVASGQVTFSTTDNTVILPEGAAIFLNSNILHTLSVSEGEIGGMTYAHFFNGDFLSGGIGSIMESKYIFPIIGNANLTFFCLYPENESDKYMLNLIKKAVQICKEEPFGYELEIRNLMSSFWIAMYKRFSSVVEQPAKRKIIDENRLRSMMKFMQEHFDEKIKLEDIAETARIGTRECSRCFLRTIGLSPMQYLNQYRLEQAAQQLIHTEENIIKISEDCGFFSNSYFSECFRKRYGCTPKDYRKSGRYQNVTACGEKNRQVPRE